MKLQEYAIVLAAMLLAAGTASATVTIDMVTVRDPGNAPILEPAPDWQMGARWVGDVDYAYNIGKTEVTASQYTEFLNAVAATDTYTLYDWRMMSALDPTNPAYCKIEQFGVSGSFTYVANRPDVPVNMVDLGDAIRFVNWLHNGQPTGLQDLTTTEDGTYFINGGTTGGAMQNAIIAGRAVDALFHLPSESEWIKAARYNPDTDTYYDYATSSSIMPTAEAPPGGPNSANYNKPTGAVNGELFDVGSYTGSVSPYGTFDQNGSVVEFTDSTYPKLYAQPGSVLLGGHLASTDFSTKVFRNPQNESHTYGFRVAAPAPSLFAPGDVNEDGSIDDLDIDLLGDAIRLGWTDAIYDLTANGTTGGTNGVIDILDLDYLVRFLVETMMGNGTEYGDFDLNGLINTTDLTVLATNFGPSSTWVQGNANRYIDEMIDTTDLTILATNFGFVATTDAIPEPMTLFVMGCGAIGLLRRRRRA